MRQILSVTLSLAVLLSLTACSTSSSGTAPTAADGGGTAPAGDTGGGSSGEKVKISIATTNVDGDPMQDLIYYFQDQVDEICPAVWSGSTTPTARWVLSVSWARWS